METDTKTKNNTRHDGLNIALLRVAEKMTQETLGEITQLGQKKISILEGKEIIEDETLEVVGKVFNKTVDYFKKYDFQKDTARFNIEKVEQHDTHADNSSNNENNGQKNVEYETVYIQSNELIADLKALYERIIKESEEKGALKQEIATLKAAAKK